ncbi:hypothetical protein [Kitasatospora atroaurantiaca]|uniref:hypothetical protein n=1 Tax=Kitasatospora atroaurantiaca TaxID=285545 RepID=UPI0014788FF8|nr:hypothetical protein [Kitasatospora atroaurantiaca]
MICALVLAGTATAVVNQKDGAPVGSAAGGAPATAADGAGTTKGTGGAGTTKGTGGANGGTNNAPTAKQVPGRFKVVLPDSFLGLPRADDDPAFAGVREATLSIFKSQPDLHLDMAIYSNLLKTVVGVAGESDTDFPSKEEAMQLVSAPEQSAPGVTIINDSLKNMDPGPQGGLMRCRGVTTRFEGANMTTVMAECYWVGDNTFGAFSEEFSLDDPGMSKTAAHTRQFRAATEKPK